MFLHRGSYRLPVEHGNFFIPDNRTEPVYEQSQASLELVALAEGESLRFVPVFRQVLPRRFDEVQHLRNLFRSLAHEFAFDELGTFVNPGSGNDRRMSEGNFERREMGGRLHGFPHSHNDSFPNSGTDHSNETEPHSSKRFPHGVRVEVE